ncbi:MAG: TolC family protein, partial [Bacteroidaceae bacterium]|nr:TolC family protein [Bacteroidaceae bacterium]
MKKKICYILAALCSLTVYAQQDTLHDQDAQSAASGTLPSLIHVGLQNNYGLQIVKNEERIAQNNATRANAGYLPTVGLTAGYDADLNSGNTTTRTRNVADLGFNAGISANWTVFDGFKIQTNYARLQELRRQSATQTRIALEDYVATLASEYYNYVQQRIRLRNLRNAVALSKERLRIVRERYTLGSASRLDLQQAQVDFNADSAQSL